MRAGIYIRVSDDRQVAGTSLDTQTADCRAFCAREGHTVDSRHVWREEGESAKLADRPKLLAALEAIRRRELDVLVVYKLDRLTRNATDGLAIRAELRRCGCRLVSVTEATGDDPVGEMVGTVLMAVAQFDNQVRAQRARRAMEAVARAGGWVYCAPTGYVRARLGKLPILKPGPHAGIIATCFRGLAAGSMTPAEACARLRAIGMSGQTACKTLRHAIYGGIIRTSLTGGTEIPAAFPGIVPAEIWRAAQAALEDSQPRPGPGRGDFPLAGVVICATCGRPVRGYYSTGRHGHRYGWYDCRRGHARTRATAADGALLEILAGCHASIVDLRKLVMREAADTAAACRAARDLAEKRRSAAEARLSRLVDGYADGIIDGDAYRSKAAEYRQQIRTARIEAEAQQEGLDTMVRGLDTIIAELGEPQALWRRLDPAGRRQLLATFGVTLTLSQAGICRTPTPTNKDGPQMALLPPNISTGAPSHEAVETIGRLVAALLPLCRAA